LKGRVDLPPSVCGERAIITTDTGDVHVFELDQATSKESLHEAAAARLEGGSDLVRYTLLQAGGCVVGDAQLASFDIQPSDKQLSPTWRDAAKGTVCQTPIAIANTIFCVRRVGEMPGVVVSALAAEKGDVYWQTCLAAPLAAEPIVDAQSGKVTLATASGGVYQLPADALGKQTVVDQPAAMPSASLRRPVSAVSRCRGGKLVLTCDDESDQAMAFDPSDPQKPLRAWSLPGAPTCPPIDFAGGLLASCDVGQVFLLDPLSGKKLCEPFQPLLRRSELPAWRQAVAIGDKDIVISDGRANLYRLQVVDTPVPHLEAITERELAHAIVSPLANVEKMVCGVDAAGKMVHFNLPDLARGGEQAIVGRCVWGPRRVGSQVMLATDSVQLYCFDRSCQLHWQVALPYGPLAGDPLPVADGYVLASVPGVVWRVAAKSGKELAKVDVGQPLGTGPVLLGNRLFIGGHDGSLHQMTAP
jgi:outer membrane protein assembly factor BamB